MAFSDQRALDVSFLFSSEAVESGALNGVAVDVIVVNSGEAEKNGGKYDFLDICFQVADYSTLTFRTDNIVIRGSTWRYPDLKEENVYTKTVQFRKDERLAGWQ